MTKLTFLSPGEPAVKPRRVIPINASGLALTACPQQWAYRVLNGLELSNPHGAEALTLGTALHKFAELIKSGVDYSTAKLTAGAIAPKQLTELFRIINGYEDHTGVPAIVNGKLALEFKFNIPYAVAPDGTQYNLQGTIDQLSIPPSGAYIYDYKSSGDSYINDINAKYSYSAQLRFYSYVIWKFAYLLFSPDLADIVTRYPVSSRIIAIVKKTAKWIPLDEQVNDFHLHYEEHLRAQIEFIHNNLNRPPAIGMLTGACNYCPYSKLCYEEGYEDLYIKVPYEPLNWH